MTNLPTSATNSANDLRTGDIPQNAGNRQLNRFSSHSTKAASLQPGCHVVTGVGVCEVVSVRMTVMGTVRVECQLANGRTMFTGFRPDELVEVKEQADASTN